MTQFENILEIILEEYARKDSEGEFDTWEKTDSFVKEKAEVLLAYTKEEPISEDLEAELDKYIKDNFTLDKEQLNRFDIEEKDYMYSMDKSDMLKMIRHFTNNYKVPASNDLEEAAKLCVSDFLCITNEEDWDDAAVDALNIFKASAKWQKQKDQSTIELAEDHAMLAGMEKMKEELMANGVNGVVHHFEKCEVVSVHYNDPTGVPMSYFMSSKGFLAGDKVKIIVIKEE